MKDLVAFDLDGTLAESKQPLQEPMGEALANLLDVAHVAVISGATGRSSKSRSRRGCRSGRIGRSCG